MIHTEAWCKEALGEEELHRLLRAHQDNPSLETAREVWRAYQRRGKLPPIDYDWVLKLEVAGEPEAQIEVQESRIHYRVDPEQEMWVPATGEIWEDPQTRSISDFIGWIATKIHRWGPSLWDGPDLVTQGAVEESGETSYPFVKISFEPLPNTGDPRADIQTDLLIHLHTSLENAKQIWEWYQE